MNIYINSRLFWGIHSQPENSKKHKNNKCKLKQIVKRIHSCQLLTDFLTPSLLPKKLLLTWTFEFARHKHSSKNLEHMVRTLISRFEFPANCSESKISQYSGLSLKGTLKLKIIRDRRLFPGGLSKCSPSCLYAHFATAVIIFLSINHHTGANLFWAVSDIWDQVFFTSFRSKRVNWFIVSFHFLSSVVFVKPCDTAMLD